MRVAKFYDKISADYHDFDYFDVLARTNQIALHHISEAGIFTDHTLGQSSEKLQIVDLGVGDGRFLELFNQKYPQVAELTGVDISAKMLALAQQKVKFTSIHTSIEQISQHLPANKFNLVCANFICAYVGVVNLLKQVQTILKPGGFLSITTSTFESFPSTQSQLAQFAQSYHPIKRPIALRLQQTIGSALVPANRQDIINIAEQFGFSVKTCKTLVTEVKFDNNQDFLEKAIRSGYFATVIDQSRIPSKIIQKISKTVVRIFDFPYEDQSVVEVVLLQKNDR